MLRPQDDLDFDLENYSCLNLYEYFVQNADQLGL